MTPYTVQIVGNMPTNDNQFCGNAKGEARPYALTSQHTTRRGAEHDRASRQFFLGLFEAFSFWISMAALVAAAVFKWAVL